MCTLLPEISGYFNFLFRFSVFLFILIFVFVCCYSYMLYFSQCVYAYVCVYACVYMCICECVSVHVYVYVWYMLSVYACVCMWECIYVSALYGGLRDSLHLYELVNSSPPRDWTLNSHLQFVPRYLHIPSILPKHFKFSLLILSFKVM